ncbi:MAG: transaldolase, partial [Acidimicrobiia bacterium]
PTIFAKAIVGSEDYDAQVAELAARDASVDEIYAALVTRDIQEACDVLRPAWELAAGGDGFVSVEVSPDLANDTEGTLAEVREWVKRVDRSNLLVKIPATREGVPAIRRALGEGLSINVTLIFSLARYREVMEAYLTGLEEFARTGGDVSTLASVASFFVSRVDTEVDRRLEEIGTEEALAMRGTAAVANARVAYREFLDTFRGPRWERLAGDGARLQRPLWASTSTKNPDFPDTLYVDTLVAPDTVNTMPISTIEAYQDHGDPHPTPFGEAEIAQARETLNDLERIGIDYRGVVQVLEDEGVDKFAGSFRELLADIASERERLKG